MAFTRRISRTAPANAGIATVPLAFMGFMAAFTVSRAALIAEFRNAVRRVDAPRFRIKTNFSNNSNQHPLGIVLVVGSKHKISRSRRRRILSFE